MTTAITYFVLGAIFTYLAFVNATETVWNPISIILLIVATIDFGAGFTFLRQHFHRKREENSK